MKNSTVVPIRRPSTAPARAPRTPAKLGVIDQVRVATRHRSASVLGFALGALVPVASWWLAHHEVTRAAPWATPIAALLVLGGLAYSAPTVYGWMLLAVGSKIKAAGFVLLVEGVLVASGSPWLVAVALACLVLINGTATACRLALGARS